MHALVPLVATLLIAGAAMAQSFDRPAMRVGDRFAYRVAGGPDPPRAWTETVVEVLAGGRYRSRIDGEPGGPRVVEFDGPGNVVQPPPAPSLKPMAWPVTVGGAWSHAVADTAAQSRAIAYRAVAVETIKTPAGAFECVRIEGTETTSVSGVGVPVPVKVWYCPAARAVARKESRLPGVGLVTLELTGYAHAR